VRETLLPYGRQAVDEDDIRAVVEVLRSDWLTTGPRVEEFESAFAQYVQARHAVAFCSGTAALHGAAVAAGLQEGKEAITTPMTFCATANCVLYSHARPVFADICSDTLNLDPQQVEQRISSRTKAILPVDYAGHPADLAAIHEIAGRNGCVVIEDACHALGAEYRGQRVGGLSHMTVFSFHPVKHITTGEGGMVTTNDDELARKLRMLRNHGINSEARTRQASGQWFYEMVLLGYNYRLTDIGCALGLSQLRKIDTNLARRRQIVARYSEAFGRLQGVVVPAQKADVNPAWHLYPIRIDRKRVACDRGQVFCALRAENIAANVHYIPVHLHPYYQQNLGYKRGDFPLAEAAYEGLISLPMFHGMKDDDVDDVIHAMEKVLGHYAS
jgi:UDP-4-amino-4,6-dideoxy-N-acetyl-beta-L-altrosamine transaminase